jgi:hypothetical protein
MTVGPAVYNRAFTVAARPSEVALRKALRDPRPAQLDILSRIVAANRNTAFGTAHGFAAIRRYDEYARQTPISDYDDYAPHIDRVARGNPRVLTHDPVAFLEPTGGSSGPSKLIPYTRSLKRQLARGILPWLCDLFVERPPLRRGRSYWAISPPAQRERIGGERIPIGAPRDADYLPALPGAVLGRMLVPPPAVAGITDLDACRHVTLKALLLTEDLTFVSVWNPSFLTLLAGRLDESLDKLLHDVERGTISADLDPDTRARLERALPARPDVASRLRSRFGGRPPDDLGELWPRLQMISCWTDAHAARSVDAMRRRFPGVEVQGKGLIATEGIVTLPLTRLPAPVAAVTSHFLEFIPERGGAPLLVDELDKGAVYEVVLTTGGGLYRYRLKDLVHVEDHVHRTPLLRFVGRADATSDLCGEKLTPRLVERALVTACESTGVRPLFALLSPRWDDPPRYDLWLDLVDAIGEAATRLAAALDTELRSAHHYGLCRRLGQLGEIQAHVVPGAERIYERTCIERGMRSGAAKPAVLDARLEWHRDFEGVVA